MFSMKEFLVEFFIGVLCGDVVTGEFSSDDTCLFENWLEFFDEVLFLFDVVVAKRVVVVVVGVLECSEKPSVVSFVDF